MDSLQETERQRRTKPDEAGLVRVGGRRFSIPEGRELHRKKGEEGNCASCRTEKRGETMPSMEDLAKGGGCSSGLVFCEKGRGDWFNGREKGGGLSVETLLQAQKDKRWQKGTP